MTSPARARPNTNNLHLVFYHRSMTFLHRDMGITTIDKAGIAMIVRLVVAMIVAMIKAIITIRHHIVNRRNNRIIVRAT